MLRLKILFSLWLFGIFLLVLNLDSILLLVVSLEVLMLVILLVFSLVRFFKGVMGKLVFLVVMACEASLMLSLMVGVIRGIKKNNVRRFSLFNN